MKKKHKLRPMDGLHSVVKPGEQTDAALNTGERSRVAADMEEMEVDARFRALIEGEYREAFNRAVSDIVRRRLRENADAAQERDRLRAGWEALGQELRARLAHAQAARWQREEQEVQMRYPAFALRDEMHNPDFVRLLTDRVHPMGLLRAYESVHFDELREEMERQARLRAERELFLRNSRPRESGAAPQAGIPQHAPMTRAARAELAKRALRGERIAL